MRKRTVVIIIVGVWNIILGAIWPWYAFLFWATYFLPSPVPQRAIGPAIMWLLTTGFISLVIILSGVGLLMLKGWGRWLTLLETGIFILLVLRFNVLQPIAEVRGVDWLGVSLELVWSGFILWYFLRKSVRSQFDAARSRT